MIIAAMTRDGDWLPWAEYLERFSERPKAIRVRFSNTQEVRFDWRERP